MTAVILSFALSGLVVLSPTRIWLVGTGALLALVYLFVSNIPVDLFGIEDFVRYSKEPLIAVVLLRFLLGMWRSACMPGELRRTDRVSGSMGGVWRKGPLAWLLALLMGWSLLSLAFTGLVGFVAYWRGIVFPAAWLLYLNCIDDRDFRRLIPGLTVGCIALIAFVGLVAIAHRYLDASFLVPESFRNRLDYTASYSTITRYGDIQRYQSFFGDPNRTAFVCLLALWCATIGAARRLRWVTLAVVAPILWMTESRTGMLVGGLWALYLFVRPNSLRELPVVLLAAMACALMAVAAWASLSSRGASAEELSRAVIWAGLVQHVASSLQVFLLGEGFGWVGQVGASFSVSDAIELVTTSGRSTELSVIDNSYLTLLSSLGVVGTTCWLVFYALALREMAAGVRERRLRRQFQVLVGLISVWALFFDALVSFPWTFLIPLLLRLAVVAPVLRSTAPSGSRPADPFGDRRSVASPPLEEM